MPIDRIYTYTFYRILISVYIKIYDIKQIPFYYEPAVALNVFRVILFKDVQLNYYY